MRRREPSLATRAGLRALVGLVVLVLVVAVATASQRRQPQDAPTPPDHLTVLPQDDPTLAAPSSQTPTPATAPSPRASTPAASETSPTPSVRTQTGPGTRRVPTRRTPMAAADGRSPARRRFAQRHPAQEAAVQDPARPDTTRWALLIGINQYEGRTHDNVASRQDAEDLAHLLSSLGWRADHVLLLTDGDATREQIVEGLAWLARKTDGSSVAVVSYSGHVKQWPGGDVDGDGEASDEALWPSDNRFITDREFVDRLASVHAGRLWVNVGGCEAAGLADPGIRQPGRVLTFSSREVEKSYEDPSVGNSVWGRFLIDDALAAGHGDTDGDGTVTVEEAFAFAAPRATKRTSSQPRGPQHPVLVDDAPDGFSLAIPAPTAQASAAPSPTPSPTPDGSGGGCLLLCGSG